MILLTGANGFIGKHFLKMLSEKYGMENITLLTSQPVNQFNCIIYKNNEIGEEVSAQLGSYDFSVVIHLGAYTPKNKDEANDITGCTSNIRFTEKLLSSLKTSVKFIFASTLDVYKNVNQIIDETTFCEPVSLYGYSKLYCEKLTEAWAKQNNSIFQILRIGHVYGKGEEKYHKFIPVTIKKMIEKEPVELWGDGSDKRSFIHVSDVCRLIIKAIHLSFSAAPINLCSESAVSPIDIILILEKIHGEKIILQKKIRNTDKRDMIFNCDKMKNILGAETVKLEDGLREEYDYFFLALKKDV